MLQNRAGAAAFGVVGMAFLQVFIAMFHFSHRHRIRVELIEQLMPTDVDPQLALVLMAETALAVIAAGLMVTRRSAIMAVTAALFSLAGAVTLLATGHWLAAAVEGGVVLLLINAVVALRRMARVIEEEGERHPLVAH